MPSTALGLQEIRKDCEGFLGELAREYYLHGAGHKADLDTQSIYRRHDGLFHRETVDAVGLHLATAEGDAERQLRILHGFVTHGHMAAEVNHYHDTIASQMSRETVLIDGEMVPFRKAPAIMLNEPDRLKRDIIEQRVRDVRRKYVPLSEERMGRLHQISVDLGYPHYTALYAATKGIDYQRLQRLTDRVLEETEELYQATLNEALEGMGVAPGTARRHDGAFLFRGTVFDAYFPKEQAVPTLQRTLAGMGINLQEQPNIILDVEPRPLKGTRAFCSMVRVPEEVYLVVTPVGGQMDYAAILHEAGHAEHFANTDAGEPFEFRLLGDLSVSETYAFLLNHLPMDPEWLEVHLGMTDSQAWLRTAYLEKLHIVRRYCAKLRYEIALHTRGLQAGMPAVYTETLSRATGFVYNEADYLSDIDDGFYTAEYLRAWVLDAMLRRRLREEYGSRWFLDRRAGGYLRGLWKSGQKYRAEELAQEMGYGGLDPSYLIGEFLDGLARPIR